MIHHIAIATPNLTTMAEFYRSIKGLIWLENKFNENGGIRSVWFETATKSILMLESFPYSKAPEALVFKIDPFIQIEKLNLVITKQTDYTIYFLDPDKNQLGYSSYPDKLHCK